MFVMKKLLRIALAVVAAFLFIVPAGAQTYYVAISLEGGGVVVMGSNGVTYNLEGKEVADIAVSFSDVMTLVRTTDVPGRWFDGRKNTHMPGWGEYVLYSNDSVYKKYPYGDPNTCCISSAALKVSDDFVVVAGTYAKRWKDTNYYYGKLWGELDGEVLYGDPKSSDGWVRMSLKRKWFQGLAEPSRGLLNVGYANTPDVDGSFSSVYHVYDCAFVNEHLYAAGWGENEYTYYNAGLAQDVYYVRRCARIWRDGKEYIAPYKNQTSSVRNITIAGSGDWPVIFTSGHHRGHPMMWNDKKEVEGIKKDLNGVITAEAVLSYNNITRRYFIIDNTLYCHENNKTHKLSEGVFDIVATEYGPCFVALDQFETTGELAAVVYGLGYEYNTVAPLCSFPLKGLWVSGIKLAVKD